MPAAEKKPGWAAAGAAVDTLSELVHAAGTGAPLSQTSSVTSGTDAQVPPPPPPPDEHPWIPREPQQLLQAKRQRLVDDRPRQPPPASLRCINAADTAVAPSRRAADNQRTRVTNDSGCADLWQQVLEQQRLLLQHQHQQVQRLQQQRPMPHQTQWDIPTVHAQQLENGPVAWVTEETV